MPAPIQHRVVGPALQAFVLSGCGFARDGEDLTHSQQLRSPAQVHHTNWVRPSSLRYCSQRGPSYSWATRC